MPQTRAAGGAERPSAGQQGVFGTGGAPNYPQTAQGTLTGSQTLVLEGYPSTEQQDILGPNNGSRRWAVAEMRDLIQLWTWAAAMAQHIKPVAPPVHAIYRFVVPDRRRRDWDNYALIVKPVQDGLVEASILVGDHYAVLTAQVTFRVERGRRALEIVLTPSVEREP